MRKSIKITLAAIVSMAVFIIWFESEREEELAPQTKPQPTVSGPKPDFTAITDVKQKKQAFFDYLLPKVALENERVVTEREHLVQMQTALENKTSLTGEQNRYAERIARLYSHALPEQGADMNWLSQALERVNLIPPAMVLIQAANESAWGTSRFATQANNYFGQWCYRKGCGLVPLSRNEGASHEVAKFDSVQQSVHAYFMNINRNRAYQSLRHKRAELAANGADLLSEESALELIDELGSYSERGEAYTSELKSMVSHNKSYLKGSG